MKDSIIQRLTGRFGSDSLQAGMHAFGATPTRQVGNVTEMEWLGKNYFFEPGNPLPRISKGSNPIGNWDKGVVGASVLMTGASAASGFMQGGFIGAARNMIYDMAVESALVKHAYGSTEIGGVKSFHHGRINGQLMNRLGKAGRAAGLADYTHRMAWGTLLAYGTGNAMGGGVVGSVGAMVGGSLGVRHAGKLSMLAGTYYGGKMVAKGTYNIAKMGHSHFQTQKMIHTDGDMSSFMTGGAFTQRERGVRAISRAQGNMRSALGREATYMHMNRSYSSPYRQGY